MANGFDPRQAAFYGGFVQVVYDMYMGDPNDLTPPFPDGVSLPDGYQLVGYVTGLDKVLFDNTTRFFGILAASTGTSPELVVAIRGTEGDIEWLIDAEFIPVEFRAVPGSGRVEDGFQSIYTTMDVVQQGGTNPQGLTGAIAAQLSSSPASLVVVGHSLGSVLATMLTLDLLVNHQLAPTLYTLASPRVGDGAWAGYFDDAMAGAGLASWRVYNEPDVVPKLPPLYTHVDTAEEVDSLDYPQIKHSLGCYHSLRTYLFCLDPSNPFGINPTCIAGTGDTQGARVV